MATSPDVKKDPSPGVTPGDGSIIRTDQWNLLADILNGVNDTNQINLLMKSASKTGAYTITADDYIILGDTTSGGFTLTLPAAAGSGVKKKIVVIKKVAAANILTVDGNAAETIDGSATYAMNNNNEVLILVSDETNWRILATYNETQQADLDMNSNKIINVTDPTSAQDAATKIYVDNLVNGLKWKAPVRVATTAAGTLATDFENGDTVDGVVLATNDRILIKDQSAGAENGIYVVQASGAPTRATDYDANSEVSQSAVFVQEGTANADQAFVLTNDGAITLGTTALTFVQFTSLGQITAGQGLKKTGATLDLDFDELTNVTDVDDANDTVAFKDADDSNNIKEVTVDNFFKGINDLPLLAHAFIAPTTEPATGLTNTEFGAAGHKQTKKTWDFPDSGNPTRIQIELPMFRRWDLAGFDVVIVWSHASGTGNVRWGARATTEGNDDAIGANFGTAVESDFANGVNDDRIYSTLSSITPGGTPASADMMSLEIFRAGDHANDTFAGVARIHAVILRPNANEKADA